MSTTTPEPLDPSFQISLPSFEGPLDLLLHLIRKHELDILDLPIAFVTERYLAYVSMMEQLDLDIASEYLVMAATLAHIKSKMLLPQEPEDQAEEESAEEEIDPRAELIRRLLEYQKYKDVAEQLGARGIAGRDVFVRGSDAPEASGPTPLAPTSLFRLLDAFQGVLKRAQADVAFEITTEGLSIQDRMSELTDLLRERREVTFEMLFEGQVTIFDLVITFMALLEMAKRRLVRIYQADPHSPIHLQSTVIADEEQTELPFDGQHDADEPPPTEAEPDEAAEALADEDAPVAEKETPPVDATDREWAEEYAAWNPDAEADPDASAETDTTAEPESPVESEPEQPATAAPFEAAEPEPFAAAEPEAEADIQPTTTEPFTAAEPETDIEPTVAEPFPEAEIEPTAAEQFAAAEPELGADIEPLAAAEPERLPGAEQALAAAEGEPEPVVAAEAPEAEAVAVSEPARELDPGDPRGLPSRSPEGAGEGNEARTPTPGPSGLLDAVADAQAVADASAAPAERTDSLDPNDGSGKEPDLAASDEDEDAPT